MGTALFCWLCLLGSMMQGSHALTCYSSEDQSVECPVDSLCARYTYFGTEFAGCLNKTSIEGADSCTIISYLDSKTACCCSSTLCNAFPNCLATTTAATMETFVFSTPHGVFELMGLGAFAVLVVLLAIRLRGTPPLAAPATKEDFSPAVPGSPKTLLPSRRRSRASSDLSGLTLPAPPPLLLAAASSDTLNSSSQPLSSNETQKYFALLMQGFASPFSRKRRTLRSEQDGIDLEEDVV